MERAVHQFGIPRQRDLTAEIRAEQVGLRPQRFGRGHGVLREPSRSRRIHVRLESFGIRPSSQSGDVRYDASRTGYVSDLRERSRLGGEIHSRGFRREF